METEEVKSIIEPSKLRKGARRGRKVGSSFEAAGPRKNIMTAIAGKNLEYLEYYHNSTRQSYGKLINFLLEAARKADLLETMTTHEPAYIARARRMLEQWTKGATPPRTKKKAASAS